MVACSVISDAREVSYSVAFLEPGPFEQEVRERGVTTFRVPTGRLRHPRAGGTAIRRLSRIIRAHEPDLRAQLAGQGAALRRRSRGRRRLARGARWCGGSTGCRPGTGWTASRPRCPPRRSAARRTRPPPRRRPSGPTGRRSSSTRASRRSGSRRSTERSWTFPPERPVVGIAGRLQPWKGQHRFLRALRELHDGGLPAHGLVVGGSAHGFSPGYERELRELIVALGLDEWVTMVGHVPDPRPFIAAMDVLVSASAMEPFGIVLLEAFVQGVPVVAVSDAGPREIVDHGVSGLLVPRPEPALLAAAIRELLADEPRRRADGASRRAARRCERFAVQSMTEALGRRLQVAGDRGRDAVTVDNNGSRDNGASVPVVALVHDNFTGPTGMGRVLNSHARFILDVGWELCIVGDNVPAELRAGARRVITVRNPRGLPKLLEHFAWCRRARAALRGVAANIVHVHSPWLADAADLQTSHFVSQAAFARDIREPANGIEGRLRRLQASATRRADDRLYRRRRPSTYLSFVSELLRDEFRRHYGEPRGGWIFRPPAPRWRPPDAPERARARAALGVPERVDRGRLPRRHRSAQGLRARARAAG